MQLSPIEWTDFTSNPIQYRNAEGKIVWACVHCSPGCLHCYSEQLGLRFKKGGPFNVKTTENVTPFLNLDECDRMRRYKPASGKRCFIGDMTDIFGEWVPDDLLNQLFSNVLEMREDVQWQILTKRADRMHKYLSWRWGEGRIPMRNIWVGVSVENQGALWRIDALKDTPVAVRFISFEPLLEDLGAVILDRIHWAIIGGESGPKSRPMKVEWVRSLLRQCREQNIVPFMKQYGSVPIISEAEWRDRAERTRLTRIITPKNRDRVPDGYVQLAMSDSKGGNIEEFEENLRVREFPCS